MVKAVIFDFSDMLTNAAEARTTAFEKVVTEFFPSQEGKGKEMSLLYWQMDRLYPDLSSREIIGKTVTEFCRKNGIKPEQDMDEVHSKYREWVSTYECIHKGVVQWLNEVKGKYKLFILTVAGRDDVMPVLQKVGIDKEFEEIITRDELKTWGMSKMSIEVYERLCDKHQLNPEECVMVGDSFIMDILPAKAAGLKTVLLCGYADRVVGDFEELSKVLD